MRTNSNIQNINNIHIPQNFITEIDKHLLGNYLDIQGHPLILGIFGSPGIGKTYQLREYLKRKHIKIYSISAADLESDRAGQPAKMLREQYINASLDIDEGICSGLVIDDIDTTVGEWKNCTGTVNHQDILAFLMHIADNPTSIEGYENKLERVPVFFTGNYIDKMYEPIVRPGRMKIFIYKPTIQDKIRISETLFESAHKRDVLEFVGSNKNKPISFFSSLASSAKQTAVTDTISLFDLNYSDIITNQAIKEQIKRELESTSSKINWPAYFKEHENRN